MAEKIVNCPECGSARYFKGYKITGGRARQAIRQCYDCGYEEKVKQ